MSAMASVFQYLKTFWRTFVLILTPIFSSLVFLNPNAEDEMAMRCAFVLLIMAAYWVTEVFPVAITALIPVALFPLLGVMSTGVVSLNYMKSVNFLFMGGLIMALAVENSGLHKRIALFILMKIGTNPNFVMLAFMIVTAFLSMWISNTASTAMMLPITQAVAVTLEKTRKGTESMSDEGGWNQKKMLMLSVAYAANVGGTGIITGSPPNLVLPAKLNSFFGPAHPLSFLSWMSFSLPLMIVNLILSFMWLTFVQWLIHRKKRKTRPATNVEEKFEEVDLGQEVPDEVPIGTIIRREYESLGSWSQQEITVLICFSSLVLFWFFRDPKVFPGWSSFFPYEDIKIGDATMTIFMVLVIFSLPTKFQFWPFQSASKPIESNPSLIQWSGQEGVEKRLQWGVILLLGGGFALSDACQKSGLSEWVGIRLSTFLSSSKLLSSFIISALTAFVTEFASNTATANVLIPILVDTSRQLCLNPIYLAFASTLSCSYAFMLPAATAPNAIVKEAANINVFDMMKIGFVMNVICVVTTVIMINTYGRLIYNFGSDLPDWLTENDPVFAECANSTIS